MLALVQVNDIFAYSCQKNTYNILFFFNQTSKPVNKFLFITVKSENSLHHSYMYIWNKKKNKKKKKVNFSIKTKKNTTEIKCNIFGWF